MTELDFDVLDLDAAREKRATLRREAGKRQPQLRLGGQTYALPSELPVDTFAPLARVSGNVGMLLRAALDAAGAADDAQRGDAVALLVDSFALDKELLPELMAAVRECAVNLMGEEAVAALLAYRPSREDYAALAKGLFAKYGVSLGEALPPSDSSPSGGTTSNATSNAGTDSTPGTSTATPTDPTSSGSAV